jgi:hypothetical protein
MIATRAALKGFDPKKGLLGALGVSAVRWFLRTAPTGKGADLKCILKKTLNIRTMSKKMQFRR